MAKGDRYLAAIGRADRMRKRPARKKYRIVDVARKKIVDVSGKERVGCDFWRRDNFNAKRTLYRVARRSPDSLFSLLVFKKPVGAKREKWHIVESSGSNNCYNY